jgi:competence protein ComGF
MITIVIILGILVVAFGFTTFNLLKKNEKQEDIISNQETILAGYMEYLSKISGIIELSDKKLKEIDHKGSFESDDEIGFFFQSVKQLQEALNAFKIKNL